MRRRNLLIMLLVAVSLWAFCTPPAEGALANNAVNVPVLTPPVSASVVTYDEVDEPVEPSESNLKVGAEPIPPAPVAEQP